MGARMRFLCLFSMMILVLALPGPTQAQDSERAQQLRRVIEGLNSPDPVTRLVTLEEAMGSDDANLKRMAIGTALSSSDKTLRATAMTAALSEKPSFVIEITGASDDKGVTSAVLDGTGGRLEATIVQFDRTTGAFLITSPHSRHDSSGSHITQGAVSGDRISFDINIRNIFSTNRGYCRGSARARDGSSVLTGRMSCIEKPFTIEIDLLG